MHATREVGDALTIGDVTVCGGWYVGMYVLIEGLRRPGRGSGDGAPEHKEAAELMRGGRMRGLYD